MLTQEEIAYFESQRHYFIENGTKASNFQWLFSKGTNFSCYLQYMEKQKYMSDEDKLNNSIDIVRIVLNALSSPFKIYFFYFTLVVCILHKFNFKNPIIKIILIHYCFRSMGDILDRLGSLLPHYFANKITEDSYGNLTYECQISVDRYEMNPLRWFITRHLATIFWYCGEIVADWYPLFRTELLVKGERSMFIIYITCGIFNITKLILIGYYLSLGPSKLYTNKGTLDTELLGIFYNNYWFIQLLVLYTSVIYDITVFLILKKKLDTIKYDNHSFLSKFRTISEFRIFVSVGISIIFLPIISVLFYVNYFYNRKHDTHIGFFFEDIRILIANVQYYMIFIDQILLILTKEPSAGSMDIKKLNLYILTNSTDSKISFDSKMIDYQYGITCDIDNFIKNDMNKYAKKHSSKLSKFDDFNYENISSIDGSDNNNDNNNNNKNANNNPNENQHHCHKNYKSNDNIK